MPTAEPSKSLEEWLWKKVSFFLLLFFVHILCLLFYFSILQRYKFFGYIDCFCTAWAKVIFKRSKSQATKRCFSWWVTSDLGWERQEPCPLLHLWSPSRATALRVPTLWLHRHGQGLSPPFILLRPGPIALLSSSAALWLLPDCDVSLHGTVYTEDA